MLLAASSSWPAEAGALLAAAGGQLALAIKRATSSEVDETSEEWAEEQANSLVRLFRLVEVVTEAEAETEHEWLLVGPCWC